MQRDQVYLAIFDVYNFTILIVGVLRIEFVKFALKKHHVMLLTRLYAILIEKAHGKHIS